MGAAGADGGYVGSRFRGLPGSQVPDAPPESARDNTALRRNGKADRRAQVNAVRTKGRTAFTAACLCVVWKVRSAPAYNPGAGVGYGLNPGGRAGMAL